MDIKNAVQIIADHLENYDASLDGHVKIANIAEEPKTTEEESVIITLIKVEEETALKNGSHTRLDHSFKTIYQNRPVYTNLYLLFSCNHNTYTSALDSLSLVVEAFQGKNVFTHLDGELAGLQNEAFRLILELQNLNLEQVNHIWGFLGGKQKPSVLYRARLIPLEAKDKLQDTGEPILEINTDAETKT